jgi:predicted ATPase
MGKHGMSEWTALGTFGGGWLRSGSVDREAGIAEMREGLAPMRLRRQELFMPLFMALLAEAETEAGHPDAGLAIIDNQLTTIERTRQRWYLSELHRTRGEILLKCRPSDAAEAESALIRAVEIARAQSTKLFELQAAVSLGRLWVVQGKRGKAQNLLTQIYGWFTEGFGEPGPNAAKALLDELA